MGMEKRKYKALLVRLHISVPRDREGRFEPVVVKKHQKDVSEIGGKVKALNAAFNGNAGAILVKGYELLQIV